MLYNQPVSRIEAASGARIAVNPRLGLERVVRLLEVDPDLGGDLSPDQFAQARHAIVVRTVVLEGPEWDPGPIVSRARPGWLGLLVLDGLMVRVVSVGSREVGELFSPGDITRPWDADGEYAPVPISMGWRVLAPARVAILDAGVASAIGVWPSVMGALMSRIAVRARNAALRQAVSQLPRVDSRLLILFWLLADVHGTVTPAGVWVDLPVTHEVLAMLIGVRRPAVTLALSRLAQSGLLLREKRDRWLLTQAAEDFLQRPESARLALPGAWQV